jgi:bifunctional aspartokinase / homoserine dehydrogenase 1
MKVLKFGGSSVADAENIGKVAEIVITSAEDGGLMVVLSAMQGITDSLIEAGRMAEGGDERYREKISEVRKKHLETINTLFADKSPAELKDFVETALSDLENIFEGVIRIRELTDRTLDRVLSFGELFSSRILSALLKHKGAENVWLDARQLISTDQNYGFASVDFKTTNAMIAGKVDAASDSIYILPGFIASAADGSTTTLGRGGSDYTAAIVAAAVDAEELQIWTDVDGMMTADPRFVRNVRHIPQISYREAMELSHFGAKVIYPPTIQPVMAKAIPLWIKNTFAPEEYGTLIKADDAVTDGVIRGITSIDHISILNLEGSGMVGIPGFSKRLFEALSRARINVILITQSSSEHSICVAIDDKSSTAAKQVVDHEFENEIKVGKIDPLKVENGFSILALVGDKMKEHTGVSGRMFTTLGHNGINITAIAQGSSERNISAVIKSADVRKAVNTLHEEFFSDGNKQINLFIAGVGTVGGKLFDQISQQHEYIADELRLNLRVVGLANSKKGFFSEDGIELGSPKSILDTAERMNISKFTDEIVRLNLRNSVFVDITASPDVVETYPKLLERSISVIACNKVAASSEYEKYQHLKDLAREFGANFFFETNVGAGLPIITTLNDLLRSGDRVNRIEAVLSGTLNFVFNNYDGSQKFGEIVRQAQDEGYTEPDPRLDLSGTDVARKILILAREAGYKLEMADVENAGFLPVTCLIGSVEDFYKELDRNEDHFRELLETANQNGKTLKYIATFRDGKASVGLEQIGPDHNFANLSGKDNAVLFYTNRYADQPLVIKGAGAGADVTAAGVFADIIRASRI